MGDGGKEFGKVSRWNRAPAFFPAIRDVIGLVYTTCNKYEVVTDSCLMTVTRVVTRSLSLFGGFRKLFALRRRVNTFKRRRMASESFVVVFKAGGYAVYVLFLLLGAYLLNQLDRYALAVSSQPMAHDIKFGDKGCLPYNSTFSSEYKDVCVKSTKDSNQPERNQSA